MNDTALRLAELIERDYYDETLAPRKAAAELRRLVAENEALREANEAFGKRQEWWNDKMVRLEALNAELVEALRGIVKFVDGPAQRKRPDVWERRVNQARAALAKWEVSK